MHTTLAHEVSSTTFTRKSLRNRRLELKSSILHHVKNRKLCFVTPCMLGELFVGVCSNINVKVAEFSTGYTA